MMAKGGKLKKLKTVMKKWQSMGKLRSTTTTTASATSTTTDDRCQAAPAKHPCRSYSDDYINIMNVDSNREEGLQPVYVGKSRRRYLVRTDIIDHPLVRELIIVDNRSSSLSLSEGMLLDGISLSCEVVLFEHLLWMIENTTSSSVPEDDHEQQLPESLVELVGFYSC